MINNGAVTSSGSVSSGEFGSIATTVSRVVTLRHRLRQAEATLMLIALTSGYPCDQIARTALSTFPRGSGARSATILAGLEVDLGRTASTSTAQEVRIACSTTTPVTANASPFSVAAKVPPAEA
jgi:hypothetical protein